MADPRMLCEMRDMPAADVPAEAPADAMMLPQDTVSTKEQERSLFQKEMGFLITSHCMRGMTYGLHCLGLVCQRNR